MIETRRLNNVVIFLQSYLEEQEKNGLIITYAGKRKEKRNIVRRRKRPLEGTDISLPCEPSVKKLRQMLANEVREGIISIGHQINPKLFSKLSVKSNVIKKEQFTVESRKHTLLEIRQKSLNQTQ